MIGVVKLVNGDWIIQKVVFLFVQNVFFHQDGEIFSTPRRDQRILHKKCNETPPEI